MEQPLEVKSLAERILRDIRSIFKKDANVVEFDIIPVEKQLINKSPVIHVASRIGLESWCVKHVYRYAYENFMHFRINNVTSIPPSDRENVQEWTRMLLLLNSDLGTAWNVRKELIEVGFISPTDELKFSELVFSRKPKSPDNFSHREWILRHLLSKNSTTAIERNELARGELRVSLDSASRYQRNYYAWTHRVWTITNLCNDEEILAYDLHLTKSWIEGHISDYSGYQYRQFLLSRLRDVCPLTMSNETKVSHEQLILEEFEMLNSFSNLYPDQEALFNHRRYVLQVLAELYPSTAVKVQEEEILFIEHHLSHVYSNNQSSKWRFELVKRHVGWVTRVLKFELDPEKLTV